VSEIAKVWFVSGDDNDDDPAWGSSPVREGSPDEIAAWLVDQPNPETLAVSVDGPGTIWARQFLSERGLVSRARS
jgi:hypothetical protein